MLIDCTQEQKIGKLQQPHTSPRDQDTTEPAPRPNATTETTSIYSLRGKKITLHPAERSPTKNTKNNGPRTKNRLLKLTSPTRIQLPGGSNAKRCTCMHLPPPQGVHANEGRDAWLDDRQLHKLLQLTNTNNTTYPMREIDLFTTLQRHIEGRSRLAASELKHILTRDTYLPIWTNNHWKAIMVSHTTKTTYTFDPLGNPFEAGTRKLLANTLPTHNIIDLTLQVQTDNINCGVWLMWMGPIWNTHCINKTPIDTLIRTTMRRAKLTNLRQLEDPTNTNNTRVSSHNEIHITELREELRVLLTTNTNETDSANQETMLTRTYAYHATDCPLTDTHDKRETPTTINMKLKTTFEQHKILKIRLSKYWALLFRIIQLRAFSIDWTWKLKKRILGILAGK